MTILPSTAAASRSLSLYSYTWDVAEIGVAPFVDEVRSAGLNSVTLACAYHGGKFLRPRGLRGRLVFPQDGTIYFKHTPGRYRALAPTADVSVVDEDILSALCDADVEVSAWVVLNNNRRMGRNHPDATTETAFRDRVLDSLCPANPDVRSYAVALCADIAESYSIDSLVLEAMGYKPLRVGSTQLNANFELNPWLLDTLGLCFCEHCLARAQTAGVDAPALRQRLCTRMSDFFDADNRPGPGETDTWLDDWVQSDRDLAGFLAMRREAVTSLARAIRDAVRSSCRLKVIAAQRPSPTGGWIDGMDVAGLAQVVDGLEATLYHSDPKTIAANASGLRQQAGDAIRLGGIVRPAHPDFTDLEVLSTAVRSLPAAGLQDLSFYNFGRMPRQSMSWIAAALEAYESTAH